MTTVALRAVFTEVPVILVMAAPAKRRGLHHAQRLRVAACTLQLGVSAQQRKVGLLRVIEDPQRPAVGRMAGLAFSTQSSLVDVIVGVALDAAFRRMIEGEGRVALRATHHAMQTQQRILGQVMIEYDIGAPGLLTMAGIAAGFELAAMRVIAAMTTGAVLGQLLARHRCGVTSVAIDLGMRTEQCKFVASGMIVTRHLPAIAAMAVGAIRAETAGVRVISLVTTAAVLWNLVPVVAAAMARDAIDLVVNPLEREPRLLEMVELRRLPFLGRMALAALLAARSTVFIVGGMTSGTGLGSLRVAAADVTGIACHRVVRARQLEIRLVVIELAAAPAGGAVALAAGLGELAAVHVIRLVTAYAGRGRLAPCLRLLVAALAVQPKVRAIEHEVGETVIELRAAELHDVRLATFVFGMTGAALADAGVRHAAVIALMPLHVGRDVLVAIQA